MYWILAGLLPVLPDADTFWIAPYGSILGHRGFTHSLIFAAAAALVAAGVTFRVFRMRFWPLFGLFFLVTASHGILDALTRGGESIPFLWPFDHRRWGNYGPIAVADIAFELPDPRSSRAIRTELLYVWLPAGLAVGLTEGYRYFRRRRRVSDVSKLSAEQKG
jgi:inner membrane protein